MGCIYLLYDDKGNGYIGKTKNLKHRLNHHKEKTQTCRSIYFDNFKCLVIEEFDNNDELDYAEQFYYDLYKGLYGDKIINRCRPLQTQKEWRENNKKRIAKYKKEYYKKNKEQLAEEKKEWYKINKEQILEQQKEWNENNKKKLAEQKKAYYQNNIEKIKEKMKEKITCECGRVINYNNKSQHIKTKKHQNYLSNNN